MPNTSLVEIFRYMTSGYFALLCLLIADPKAARELAAVGQASLAGASLAVGALVYVVYRAVLYTKLIIPFQDWWQRDPCSWRLDLMKRFGLRKQDAILLYVFVRRHVESEHKSERSLHFAQAHYGYIASFTALAFVIVAARNDRWWPALCLLIVGALVLTGTAHFHRRGEEEEKLELRTLGDAKVTEIYQKLFGQPGSTPNSGLNPTAGANADSSERVPSPPAAG